MEDDFVGFAAIQLQCSLSKVTIEDSRIFYIKTASRSARTEAHRCGGSASQLSPSCGVLTGCVQAPGTW